MLLVTEPCVFHQTFKFSEKNGTFNLSNSCTNKSTSDNTSRVPDPNWKTKSLEIEITILKQKQVQIFEPYKQETRKKRMVKYNDIFIFNAACVRVELFNSFVAILQALNKHWLVNFVTTHVTTKLSITYNNTKNKENLKRVKKMKLKGENPK